MGYHHDFTPAYGFAFEMAHSQDRSQDLRVQGQDWTLASSLDEFNCIHAFRLSPGLKLFVCTGISRNELTATQAGLEGKRITTQPGLALGLARQLAPGLDLTLSLGHVFGLPVANLSDLRSPSLETLTAGLRVSF